MRWPRRFRRLLGMGGLVFTCAVLAGTAAAETTALLVFVSYRGNVAVPVHPRSVRVGSSRTLAEELTAHGSTVITVPELEPLMRRLRLRSERDLSRACLHELRSAFDAERLVVVRLVTYDDRVVLLGRAMSTDEGWLRWAAAEEEEAGPDPWKDAATAGDRLASMVRAAAGRLLVPPIAGAPAEPSEGLVPLPLSSSGMERGDSDLAQLCLLRSLLAVGRWRVPDPSLVVDEMQKGGFDPYQLSDAARRRLADGFSSPCLLVPRVAAFPATSSAQGAIQAFDDFQTPSGRGRGGPPVFFTLTLIDSRSGLTLAGHGEYLKPDDAPGLFGRARGTPLAKRYEEGTQSLVRFLLNDEGSS